MTHKRRERIITFSIIAGLILVIILMQQCGGWRNKCPDPEIKTVMIHDTIPGDTVFVHLKNPDSIPVPVTIIMEKWMERAHSDTVEVEFVDDRTKGIIKDFYSVKEYRDTLSDNDVEVVIHEGVFKNTLKFRDVWIKNSRETSISSTETTEIKYQRQRFKMFIGGFVGGGSDHFVAGGSLMMIPRRDNVAVHYSFEAFNQTHMLGAYWKIHFKRRNK